MVGFVAIRELLALFLRPAFALAEASNRIDEVLLLIAQGEIHKPGTGLEPVTPSLPWKCSTN